MVLLKAICAGNSALTQPDFRAFRLVRNFTPAGARAAFQRGQSARDRVTALIKTDRRSGTHNTPPAQSFKCEHPLK